MKSIALLFLFTSHLAFADFDETLIQVPLRESNEESLYSTSCRTRDHLRWDVCYNVDADRNYSMKSFKFQNTGINKIVTTEGIGIGREYEFQFEGQARSDLGLLIWDSPDENESHAHLKLMVFFPKEVLPAIRYESDANKDILIVTLPTREEVVFNGKTREIISGVLSEGAMKNSAKGPAIAPDVRYTGRGVVVEASAVADWPVGYNSLAASKIVSIKKYGKKTCLVPSKDLWYTDANKGGNVFFNKKLISNEAFDLYVQKYCGFSIY